LISSLPERKNNILTADGANRIVISNLGVPKTLLHSAISRLGVNFSFRHAGSRGLTVANLDSAPGSAPIDIPPK
jgi:hypothetical protein